MRAHRPPAIASEISDKIRAEPWARSLGIEYIDLRRASAAYGFSCSPTC
jgi:hypothetical protein